MLTNDVGITTRDTKGMKTEVLGFNKKLLGEENSHLLVFHPLVIKNGLVLTIAQ